jgi:hypothetical protein
LNNPISAPRRVWGRRRFQRSRSNELWQGDFKLTEDDEWMISYLDDHSRFVPGSGIHHNPTAKHAIKLLVDPEIPEATRSIPERKKSAVSHSLESKQLEVRVEAHGRVPNITRKLKKSPLFRKDIAAKSGV